MWRVIFFWKDGLFDKNSFQNIFYYIFIHLSIELLLISFIVGFIGSEEKYIQWKERKKKRKHLELIEEVDVEISSYFVGGIVCQAPEGFWNVETSWENSKAKRIEELWIYLNRVLSRGGSAQRGLGESRGSSHCSDPKLR